jgi:ATP-dependent Lon protease
MPKVAGSTVTIQPFRRVRILSFAGDSGGYHATIQEVDEGAIEGAPDLATAALSAFTKHADAYGIQSPPALRATSVHGDAGRLADSLAIQSRISPAQKQELLEIFEPIPRLKRLVEMLEAA